MTNNPKRVPYSDKVKARCREMREQGYSNIQITEATSVPGSTIARWAAEGGWRVRDLVEEPEFVVPVAGPDRLYAQNMDLSGLGDEAFDGFARADSSASLGRAAPAQSLVMSTPQPDRAGRSRGEPEVNRKGEQNNDAQISRQTQLEDALERAAIAAEDAITKGNFAAAGKATQMADTLSRALERVRASAPEEKPNGIFYSFDDVAKAREELTRRLDRLAKTLRADEMDDPEDEACAYSR